MTKENDVPDKHKTDKTDNICLLKRGSRQIEPYAVCTKNT